MVDHGHALIQLIRDITNSIKSPQLEKFCVDHVNVTGLRNFMDHLSGNLNRLAESKVRRPPVYGALSFAVIRKVEKGEVKELSMLTATAGSLLKEKHVMPVGNLAGQPIEAPVGFFNLAAIDLQQNLSSLHRDAIALRTHFNNEIAERACEILIEAAKMQGLDEEKVLGTAAQGLVTEMLIEFSDDE